MTPPTRTPSKSRVRLQPEQISTLLRLATLNRDAAQRFREAADRFGDPMLAAWARDVAERRDRNADQIETSLTQPHASTSAKPKAERQPHPPWLEEQATPTGDPACLVLAAIQASDKAIRDEYERAVIVLRETLEYRAIAKQLTELVTTQIQLDHALQGRRNGSSQS